MRISAKSSLFVATLGIMAIMPAASVAGDQVLTEDRLEKVAALGKLTGVGLFCGHLDDAVPLKEVVVDVADKHKMDEALRAKLGNAYHSNRDKAFNAGKDGDYECPKLSLYRSEALLAKLTVVQAFE